MPKDFSYGIIPVFRDEKQNSFVLLVAKKNTAEGKYWGFPKGHPDSQSENPKTVALRECKEETNLTPILVGENMYTDQYITEKNGTKHNKIVSYFVGIVDSTNVTIDNEELSEYRWVPNDLVDHFITRDSTKTAYCLAEHEVETLGINLLS